MDLNKAMDDFQERKAKQIHESAQTPWDEFYKLRGQKTKLIAIQMIGVAISLVLQLICGLNKLLSSDVLMWWILPLAIWCIVFFVLISRVQSKIDKMVLDLKERIRRRQNDQC